MYIKISTSNIQCKFLLKFQQRKSISIECKEFSQNKHISVANTLIKKQNTTSTSDVPPPSPLPVTIKGINTKKMFKNREL